MEVTQGMLISVCKNGGASEVYVKTEEPPKFAEVVTRIPELRGERVFTHCARGRVGEGKGEGKGKAERKRVATLALSQRA